MAHHTATYPCVCCGGTSCWTCSGAQPATLTVALAGLTKCPANVAGDGSSTDIENPLGGFPNNTVTLNQSEFDPCQYFLEVDHVADIVTRDAGGTIISSIATGATYTATLNGDGTVSFQATLAVVGAAVVFGDATGTGAVVDTFVCDDATVLSNGHLVGGCGIPDADFSYYGGTATITY